MKKYYSIKILLFIFLFCSFLQAQEQSFTNKLFKFSLGYLTGQATHEVGHYLVAWSLGVKIYPVWNLKNIPPLSYETELISGGNYSMISAGGFFAEYTASEIILASSSLKIDDENYNYFLCGWLLQTILSPLGYTLIEETNSNFCGDIWSISRFPNRCSIQSNRNTIEAFIIGHSILTALRMFLKLKETDRFQINSTSTSISMQITF
jgi:hypothetical protein